MTRLPDGKQVVDSIIGRSSSRRDEFRIGGRLLSPEEVVSRLDPMLTDERKARIESVLNGRTYSVVTVIEGLVNSGNVSAVMRTAEGLGFQRMDVISGSAPYKHSVRTTQGAEKWLDVHRWETPGSCCEALQAAGYRVVATHLGETAAPIADFDFTVPTALVFGNELGGISEELLEASDASCIIPIEGFVQSFNISVAAAISLYHIKQDRVRRLGRHGDLPNYERDRLRADFYLRALRNSEEILAQALAREF